MVALGGLIYFLILTACQPIWCYFVRRDLGTAFIVRSYLHFCEVIS